MKLNPYVSIIIAATLAASSGIFIKSAKLPSTSITFFRMSIPIIVLITYFAIKKTRINLGNYKIMLLASSLNAVRMILFIVGYMYASLGNAIIIMFTWPIFATIFSMIILKEKVSKRNAVLIIVAFLGIAFVYANKEFSLDDKETIGMAAMLLCAIIYSLTTVIFKKELTNHTTAETIFFQNIVGAIIFLPFVLLSKPLPTQSQIIIASSYGLIVGLFAFLFFFYALQKIKVSTYSIFAYWEVLATVFFGILLYDERITANMLIGGLLIISAGLFIEKEKSDIVADIY